MPTAEALYPDAFEDWDQLRAVAPLTRSDQQRQRAETAFPGKVDLGGQTAPRTAESFVGAVLPRC
ncbi:hypothetical protein ADK52_29130 [Streptomyces sp. WM6372]|nr:hypothetical protein ADK52_29130 [Streptomyces sp. WM6372]